MTGEGPAVLPQVRLALGEVVVGSFEAGSVVQLVGYSAEDPFADAVPLAEACVVLTDRRLLGLTDTFDWVWLLDDVEQVVHGGARPWSIVTVEGVLDHGVAVAPDDISRFRTALDAAVRRRPVKSSSGLAPPAPPVVPPPTGDPLEPATGASSDATETIRLPPAPDPGDTPALPPPAARVGWADRVRRERLLPFGGQNSAAPSTAASPGIEAAPLASLEARDVSAWFGTHHVLDRVSLRMEAGQVTALIGPSGCGKSTFLRILNRMHEMIPSASLAGEVVLDGADIYDRERRLTDARRQIGMVFQKPNPFPAMSIYDNVVASFRLTGTKASSAQKDEVVESCLRKAGLWNEVQDRLRSPGGGLSGGQQQRLCIARALAIRPRVLLMDEPCSALDPTSTRRIEQTITELADEVTIVIVTHNMQQAARVSHQCAFFLAEQGTPGVIVEHGPTAAMFGQPQDPRTSDYVNGRFG